MIAAYGVVLLTFTLTIVIMGFAALRPDPIPGDRS